MRLIGDLRRAAVVWVSSVLEKKKASRASMIRLKMPQVKQHFVFGLSKKTILIKPGLFIKSGKKIPTMSRLSPSKKKLKFLFRLLGKLQMES